MESQRTFVEELMLENPYSQSKEIQVKNLLNKFKEKCFRLVYIVDIISIDQIGPIVFHMYDTSQTAFVSVRFTALVHSYYKGLILPMVKINKIDSVGDTRTARATYLDEANLVLDDCPPELVPGMFVAVQLITATLLNHRRRFLLTAHVYRRQPPTLALAGPEPPLPPHPAERLLFDLPAALEPLPSPPEGSVVLVAAGRYFRAPADAPAGLLSPASDLLRTAAGLFAAADAHPELLPIWEVIYSRA